MQIFYVYFDFESSAVISSIFLSVSLNFVEKRISDNAIRIIGRTSIIAEIAVCAASGLAE